MNYRPLLLRAMLVSLALAAVAGVCAVLLAGQDVVWRVASTGVTAAFACGLLLAASRLVDRETTRAAGLLGMAAVIAEFLLGLVLIWELAPWGGAVFNFERVGLTVVALGIITLPAMFCLALTSRKSSWLAGYVGVAVCIVSFLAMLAGTWWPDSWSFQEKWWNTAWMIGLCGMIAVACLAGMGSARRPWRWAGVAASAVACAMALVATWKEYNRGGGALACVLSVAVMLGYLNLALLVPLSGGQRWVRWVSFAAVVVAAVLTDVIVTAHEEVEFNLLARIAGAAGVVAACGTLALVVLARVNRRVPAPAPAELTELALVCPQCRKQQTLPVGGAACANCGLRIHIRLEEPRCSHCGYLLYGLTSGRCPECGTPASARTPADVSLPVAPSTAS